MAGPGWGRVFQGVSRTVPGSLSSLGPTKKEFVYRKPVRAAQGGPDTTKARHYHNSRKFSKYAPSHSPQQTILTLPGATQRSVIDAVGTRLSPLLPRTVVEGEGLAAVILASPRHASWLTDTNFMSNLVSVLRPRRESAQIASLHVLAAVVDGFCPQLPGREMQDGLSIQFGKVNSLLPALWDEPTILDRSVASDAEPSYLSMLFGKGPCAGVRDGLSITVPLANTLFQTGRRSTLFVSEWGVTEATDQFDESPLALLRMAEKRTQTIDLGTIPETLNLAILPPLVPITHPRMILEGLGNILAKVDIEGEPSPASKELQVNIPRWLEARRSQSASEHVPGPVGVWALVIPGHFLTPGKQAQAASAEAVRDALLQFHSATQAERLGTAAGKLAFEMSTGPEQAAWQMRSVLGDMLFKGAHLHKILSGGGEWGAKASLLSLDPQTSYGQQSEEEELDAFQRVFRGEENAGGAIAKPGDFVQFFVERVPDPTPTLVEQRDQTSMFLTTSPYPPLLFGVGDSSMRDQNHSTSGKSVSVQAQKQLSSVQLNHFGALSAEGLYLRCKPSLNTKLDVPGTMVVLDPWLGSSSEV